MSIADRDNFTSFFPVMVPLLLFSWLLCQGLSVLYWLGVVRMYTLMYFFLFKNNIYLAVPSLSYGIWDQHVESTSPNRDRTQAPCKGAQSRSHWTTRKVPTLMLLISKTFTWLLPLSVIYAVDFSDIAVIMLRTFLLYLISWVFSMNRYWIFSNAFSAPRWSYDFWFFTLWIFYMFFSLITDGLTILCIPALWLQKMPSMWVYEAVIGSSFEEFLPTELNPIQQSF